MSLARPDDTATLHHADGARDPSTRAAAGACAAAARIATALAATSPRRPVDQVFGKDRSKRIHRKLKESSERRTASGYESLASSSTQRA